MEWEITNHDGSEIIATIEVTESEYGTPLLVLDPAKGKTLRGIAPGLYEVLPSDHRHAPA